MCKYLHSVDIIDVMTEIWTGENTIEYSKILDSKISLKT